MEVDLGPGHIVLGGVPALHETGTAAPHLLSPCLLWPRSPISATAELFFKYEIINGQMAQEGRTASPCQVWSKLVKLWSRYGDFSIFPRWWPSAILDLLCVFSDHPRRAFGGLYHCANFGCNRWSSFDNMHVFRFREFGLKTPIHAPILGFWGILPLNGEQYQRNPKKADTCAMRVRVV